MTRQDLQIENVAIAALKPYARNPRTHSKKQLKQIEDSIRRFGWTNPVLIDREGGVIAGHGRLEAAKAMGLREVPAIRFDHMSEAEKRAYVIADNRLAENAGWDRELLAIELQDLVIEAPDLDITLTGFETAEIDLLIGELDKAEPDEANALPEIDETLPSVTVPGDLWLLGRHRLLCADARDGQAWARLMDGETAEMVFTDPPYNVPVEGHVSGLGAHHHAEFAMASGEMSREAFQAFLTEVLGNMAAQAREGSLHYVCMDWRHLGELLHAGDEVYREMKNLCVWTKSNGGMGSLYRSQHELVGVFKKGKAPHINNVELGKHGRYRSNVWAYAGMNSFGGDRDEALAMHPTVKPVALVEDAILDATTRGGIVIDGFAGAGTTLMAAERAGRRAFCLEIEPRYVDVTLRRFRKTTGIEPIHAESGFTFAEIE
ncbi:DNA modification methylase [Parvibaculum indicum]|jgi:DNA modification methylase|uniref:site-specific DNA-methyltransferase n=1 Tax=Parvibaculum TaxID=256616 RepID=UPI000C913F61|nr:MULTISPECIES: DNA methyltransferase [Parvibaculum]MAB14726.1 DNA methylase N-4 [Parvibaculum sp.]NIJ43520.1 DNA modification methylase [Parvibaculum indicum]